MPSDPARKQVSFAYEGCELRSYIFNSVVVIMYFRQKGVVAEEIFDADVQASRILWIQRVLWEKAASDQVRYRAAWVEMLPSGSCPLMQPPGAIGRRTHAQATVNALAAGHGAIICLHSGYGPREGNRRGPGLGPDPNHPISACIGHL